VGDSLCPLIGYVKHDSVSAWAGQAHGRRQTPPGADSLLAGDSGCLLVSRRGVSGMRWPGLVGPAS